MLQDAVVWFSSGGTKSVLHYDAVDNINCLFDGTKELLMINKVGLLYSSFYDPNLKPSVVFRQQRNAVSQWANSPYDT